MSSHANTYLPKNVTNLNLRQNRQKSQDENLIKINKNIPLDENKENLSKNILQDQKYVNKIFIKFFVKFVKFVKFIFYLISYLYLRENNS